MKRFLFILFGVFIIFLSNAQNRQTRKALRRIEKQHVAEKVDSVIESRNYIISINSADPMGWPSVQLTSDYSVEVSSDSVMVYLPYFGRAYQVDFLNDEGGIKLKEKLMSYIVDKKKDNHNIRFEAKTSSDKYKFRISVSSTGYGTITVSSNNRQVISYNGILNDIDF